MLGRKWVAEKNEVRYLAEKVKLGISILLPEALLRGKPQSPMHHLKLAHLQSHSLLNPTILCVIKPPKPLVFRQLCNSRCIANNNGSQKNRHCSRNIHASYEAEGV
jgi:hypothetical protein